MPYNFVADNFHRNFVADFIQANCDFTRKMAVLHFLALLWRHTMITLDSLESV